MDRGAWRTTYSLWGRKESQLSYSAHTSRGAGGQLTIVNLVPVFVNKVVLAHNHTHFYCLWLLSNYKGRTE